MLNHLVHAFNQNIIEGLIAIKILVVEDEAEIRDVIVAYFRREGWKVDVTPNGNEALQMFDYQKHDLVILDLKLEGLAGEEVCQLIREKSKAPIIMLTSKSLETDIIKGLNLGADDYIVKPFRVKELVARVKAIARRTKMDQEQRTTLSFDDGALRVNLSTKEVFVENQLVRLTNTEYKLLSVFVNEPMKLFNRSDLMYKALGYRFHEDGRSLDVHIKNLRKKIEREPRTPEYVETVVGIGYRFAKKPDE